MSKIKVHRASKISKIGACRLSFAAMIARIPADVAAALTSRQIAFMVDAMWDACQEAKCFSEAECIAQGAVWDAKNKRFHDLAAH